MNKLALGTVQFGQPYGLSNKKINIEQAARIIKLAADNGFDTIDTAIAYGSEQVLGLIGVNQWNVITKLPAISEGSIISKWVESSINQSLERLNIDRLEGVLLHCPEQLTPYCGESLYAALQNLKDNNKVKKIGISIYSPDELDELIPKYQFDIVQAPLNVFDRSLITSGWLDRLYEMNIEVHARSVFLQGLLLNKRPEKFNCWGELFTCWENWLSKNDVSAIEACLSFALLNKKIHRVIVGVDSIDHLQEIISASKTVINIPDELSSNDPKLINPSRW